MERENIEIEAKFYIRDLEPLREILVSLGGRLIHERVLERNWRFDTPSRRLSSAGEVLRIREDNRIRLTYKRPLQGTLERMEIEIEVDDSKKTRMFLEAIGFEVFFVYEKFRETYKFEDVEIVLDEVPYGCFVEIEGPSIASVQEAATKLKLNWKHRLTSTYLGLFEQLKEKLHLPFSDATFDAFSQVGEIPLDDLNLVDGLQSDLPMEQRE
jgi:adenylate cyclase class 2